MVRSLLLVSVVWCLSTGAAGHTVSFDIDDLVATRVGETLVVDLAEDLTVEVEITRLHSAGAGLLSLSGRIDGGRGEPAGQFNLVVRDDVVTGIMRVPSGGVFRLQGNGPGPIEARSVDEKTLPGCGMAAEHAGGIGGPPGRGGGIALDGGPCDDGSVVDLLLVYTPLARIAIGGTTAMLAEIDLAIDATNDAYTNSNIPTQLNLVHAAEVNYDESGDYSGHLNRLTNQGDGWLDEVHDLRDQYDADMVDMFVDDGQFCGIAWLMTVNSPDFEDSAFSVTTWYCAANLVLAHELGHNMGCCHAVGDGGGCFGGGLFNYSVGWRFNGASNTLWRTVMAYSPGQRISHFSDPDIDFDNEPTGVPVGNPDEANNASTLRQTMLTTSQFRCSIPTCQAGRIHSADIATGDSFAHAVDIESDVSVLGAPGDDDNGIDSGSAYVFRDDGSPSWTQEAKLTASDGTSGDAFGLAVSLAGDVIVVGAPSDDDTAANAGSAYVFRSNGAGWPQEQKLTASDAMAGAIFGISVSIDGDVIAIGAESDSAVAFGAGAVYVFRYDGANWVQEQKLTAPDGGANHGFGRAVALSSDSIMVGSYHHDQAGTNAGAAYVYTYDGANWSHQVTLIPGDLADGDLFGAAVALDGDRALVGAYYHDQAGLDAGAVYPYRFDGANWIAEAKLFASDAEAGDAFGLSVDLDGNLAVIGAYAVDFFGTNSGAFYVFRRTAGWIQEARLYASDHNPGDRFGYDVAINAEQVIASAFSNDEFGDSAGAAEIVARGSGGFDCDGNGQADVCDIEYGWAIDDNGDGVPDECACPWDVDGDLVVGTADLLSLLAAWGTNPGGPPDFDGDGNVGTTDLLELLANWGLCGGNS